MKQISFSVGTLIIGVVTLAILPQGQARVSRTRARKAEISIGNNNDKAAIPPATHVIPNTAENSNNIVIAGPTAEKPEQHVEVGEHTYELETHGGGHDEGEDHSSETHEASHGDAHADLHDSVHADGHASKQEEHHEEHAQEEHHGELAHEEHHEEHHEDDHKENHEEHQDTHDTHQGHGHHGQDKVASSIALMLLGTVGWVMSLFYFVNFPDRDIQQATWDTLSSMISIFCAVLFFSASQDMLIDFAGEAHHHGPPPFYSMVSAFARFFLFFILMQASFYVLKGKLEKLIYFVRVWRHVVGFAAIESFGSLLHLEFFSSSVFWTSAGVVLTTFVLILVYHPCTTYREGQEGKEEWIEECAESEIESVALAVGLMVSMVIRQCISGDLPPVHGDPQYKSHLEVWTLFAASLLVGGLVMAISMIRSKVVTEDSSKIFARFMHTLEATASMTMGWSLLFWGYWEFYSRMGNEGVGVGGRMSARVIMALVFSAFVLWAIVAVDFVADRVRRGSPVERGLRGLLTTLALLMGLSWEAAFTEAVHSVANQYSDVRARQAVSIFLSTALCLVVLPAWAMYILPQSLHTCITTHREDDGCSSRAGKILTPRHTPPHTPR